jgi:hypothetical protein
MKTFYKKTVLFKFTKSTNYNNFMKIKKLRIQQKIL